MEDRKPVLGHFLQWQEADLLERQPMSQLSFSGNSSSRCAKYASWNFYPMVSVLASRRQLMCSHLGLPPSCPSVPSSLTYSSYGLVPDFLITLLWVFPCLLETPLKYRWLKWLQTHHVPDWIPGVSSAHSKTRTVNDTTVCPAMQVRNLCHFLDFLCSTLCIPNPPPGPAILPPK